MQQATYGRLLEGRPDAMIGWTLAEMRISDPGVVALSGRAIHTIARRTGDPGDRIDGVVFAISAEELAATDAYEVDPVRIETELESGTKAYVYVSPDSA